MEGLAQDPAIGRGADQDSATGSFGGLQDLTERQRGIDEVSRSHLSMSQQSSISEDTALQELRAYERGVLGEDLDGDISSEVSERAELLSSTHNAPKTDPYGETSWRRESVIILGYAAPLIAISVLELSQRLIPVILSGRLGSRELAAVSLAMMTAQCTGYTLYGGLATALDTMCAQACGKGRRDLIGLYVQRMTLCLWIATVPVAFIWYKGTQILTILQPDPELATAAGRYLKVLIIGAPGHVCFESGRRYTQAQGQYSAIGYALLVTTLLNGILSYYLAMIHHTGILGLATSLVITQTTLPMLLALFTGFFYGYEQWPRPSTKLLQNWTNMLKLSTPGVIMLMCDNIAFEALSLASAQLGTAHLAANMILYTVTNFAFRFPTGLAIASGTRVAHLVGAASLNAVNIAIRVAFVLAAIIGLLNGTAIILFRSTIVSLYTRDAEVAKLATKTCIVIGVFQMVDTAVAQCEKLLYGLGRQRFGAVVSTLSYIVIGIPSSMGLTFGLHLGLDGLWSGLLLALVAVSVLDMTYLAHIDVSKATADAGARLNQDDATTA